MLRIGCFIIALFQFFYVAAQTKKKILFLGNSYTYANNLPQLIADVALSKSDTVVYDQNTPGGYTFNAHCSNAITWQKIRSQKWDIVVLQAQSQEPSYSPANVMTYVYPYAKQLCDSIRAANSCTEIMFYMTWGRKNSDMDYCATYSPVCTYNGMQARLRESYMIFKDSFMTSVAPVGVAWKNFRTAFPLVDLYVADESHPSLHGSYLAACVFYSSIFKKTTVGSNFNPSLPSADVANIQTIASQTVLDSVKVWNLGSNKPTSDFSYTTTTPFTCQFTNLSGNSTSFQWSFGSTVQDPVYTFPGPGTYTVELKSTNACTTDSVSKIITFTGIKDEKAETISCVYFQNQLYIDPITNISPLTLFLFSADGKLVMKRELPNEKSLVDLCGYTTGLYLVKISSKHAHISKKIVISPN